MLSVPGTGSLINHAAAQLFLMHVVVHERVVTRTCFPDLHRVARNLGRLSHSARDNGPKLVAGRLRHRDGRRGWMGKREEKRPQSGQAAGA
ncbi:hypothetical protein BraRD5C2_59880 [Bradyrhizobium sp. RD5-C2]|nr:hypothetical protein BraRD5C2_59880 [Bradyrhizobium sp. RD5-C2]